MRFFKKDKQTAPQTIIPQLTCLLIRVNLTELDQWIEKDGVIDPIDFSKWNRDQDILEYEIQLLPTENFAFFHKKTQSFSSSLNAAITMHEDNRSKSYVLYWDWNKSYFRAYIDLGNADGSANYKNIFSVPIDEIIHVIKTGKNHPDTNIRNDPYLLKVDEEHPSPSVCVEKRNYFSVQYSNQVFSICVLSPSANDFELYN